MTNRNALRNFVIGFGVFTVLFTILFIVLSALKLLDNSYALDIVFTILIITFYSILAISLVSYLNFISTLKQVVTENKYNLRRDYPFYNYYLFNNRISKLERKKRLKDKDAYIVAFTATKKIVMKNSSRNDVITEYCGYIADFLDHFLGRNSAYANRDVTYCYYHGIFLIYLYEDFDSVKYIVDDIENGLYQIAADNKLNVYVQPFFGVTKVDRGNETLIVSIDHASSARDNAERKYEDIDFFDPTLQKNIHITDVEEIRQGIENDEFVVYYQPKFSLKENRFVGCEALVRWNSKRLGLLPPSKFIDIAENSGLIHMLDEYVFTKVCIDLRETKKKGRRLLPVSVNFSMQEFYDTNFVDDITRLCKDNGVLPSLIEIEITESTSQTNTFMTSSVVKKLKEVGFRVLMDDFGTGYSNIENLMVIPFDAVKLDRSYVERITADDKSFEIVKLLINLCKVNNLEIIAEGVDNINQVELLRRLKCDTIQGYYYSKPIAKEEFDKFLLPNGNPFEKKGKEHNEI